MEEKMINVLWVDDDPTVRSQYPREAWDFGLHLHDYECWEDAERDLLEHFDDWDAIILDAKCKLNKTSDAKATKFLANVNTRLSSICSEKKRQIHWYVLSAGGAEVGDIVDLVPEDRKSWDSDWDEQKGRPYYLKTTEEREILYQRISQQLTLSKRTQIKNVFYRDAFDALERCKIDRDASVLLEDLLLPIHFSKSDFRESHMAYALRKIVEYIFRALIEKWGILPEQLVSRNQKDEVNISWSSQLLADKSAGTSESPIPNYGRVIDEISAGYIKNILFATSGYVHTWSEEKTIEAPNLLEHLGTVLNSPYIIRSYALQLCDFILHVDHYIADHQNIEENKEKWKKALDESKKKCVYATGILEVDALGYTHIGEKHYIRLNQYTQQYLGKIVNVDEESNNTDRTTCRYYEKYANHISLCSNKDQE